MGWQIRLSVRASAAAAAAGVAVAVRTAGWLNATVFLPALSLSNSLSCMQGVPCSPLVLRRACFSS